MKKVLILGGTGYLGSNIATSLSSYCYVTITGRKSVKSYFLNIFQDKNIIFETTDLLDLNKIFALIDVNEYVIFTIPNIQPHQSRPFFHSDFLKVITPAKIIFRYASIRNKKVIFLSSGGSVYGAGGSHPHSEKSIPMPITKYGKYKLALDNYLLTLNSKYNSKNVILRIANPYGGTFNDTFQQGFINSTVRNIKSGNVVEVWGDGFQIRDFVYIEDLVELVELIMDDKNSTGIFNCGSGVGYSLRDIIDMIQDTSDLKFQIKFIESYEEKIKSNILNIEKAYEYLGWHPKHELSQKLIDLLTPNNQ